MIRPGDVRRVSIYYYVHFVEVLSFALKGENDETPPTTTMDIHTLKPMYIMCNNDTDCETHKFERCRKLRSGHVGKCVCIAGHSWTRGGTACEGVKHLVFLSVDKFRYLIHQCGLNDASS